MSKIDKHADLCNQIHKIYASKNHDYGDSFGKSIEEFGPIAGVVRMEDKFNRIKTLIKKGGDQKATDESMRDSLLDLANYAIMLAIELGDTEEYAISKKIDHFTNFRSLIKEEFTDFLVKHKYPSGISDMDISYESNYSVATWTVNTNGLARTVALPNIELLSSLDACKREEHYIEALRWITPC